MAFLPTTIASSCAAIVLEGKTRLSQEESIAVEIDAKPLKVS